jgi:glutathione S-transferase
MKLYVSSASPFARKALITISELGLGDRVVAQPTTVTPISRNDEVARGNPLVKLPTLVLDDGTSLFDSRVICEYLDHLSGVPRLFPAAGLARWNALRRQALADGLMDAAVLLRYEQAMRPEAMRWTDWMAGQGAKITGALDALEGDAAGFGTAFDIGHIACACALGYLDLRHDHLHWRNSRPALAAWFAVVSQRPSMVATVPRA